MKSTPLDTIIWKTQEAISEDDLQRRDFDFYFQNQKVGKCSICLRQNVWAMCDDKQFFPDSWLNKDKRTIEVYGMVAPMKSFLEIEKLDFSNFQGQGFGRMGLQMLFKLSQNLGTEGRLSLTAKKQFTSLRDPASFYEHCGFEGNKNREGRKYFNPTLENIKRLFSKTIPVGFVMKEISIKKNPNLLINPKTGKVCTPDVLKKILKTNER